MNWSDDEFLPPLVGTEEGPAGEWTHEALKRERQARVNRNREFISTDSSMQSLETYWESKTWLSEGMHKRIKQLLRNKEVIAFLSEIPTGQMLRHDIILTIVYFFWYPDPLARAFKLLRRNSKQWKSTLHQLVASAHQLAKNVAPMADLFEFVKQTNNKLAASSRTLYKTAEEIKRVVESLGIYHIDDASSRRRLLRLYGYTERGNMAKVKANCGLERLCKAFEKVEKSPHYDWLARVENFALDLPWNELTDQKSLRRRIERYRRLAKGRKAHAELLYAKGKRPPPSVLK